MDVSAGKGALKSALADAHVLITDLSQSEMSEWISYEDLKAAFPSLVIVAVSSWGLDAASGYPADGAFGSTYSGGPCLVAFSGSNGRAKVPAQHMFDQIASLYIFSASSIALFHHARTGEGQLCEVNLSRVGYWLQQVVFTWATKDPEKANMFGGTIEDLHWASPVATFNCYKTSDGMWVQLLGLEIGRHIFKVVDALGIKWSLWPSVAWTALTKVLTSKAKSKMVKLKPLFIALNKGIQAGFDKITYAQFKAIAAEKDVWYCPVRVPAQLLAYEQAIVNDTFCYDSESRPIVNAPVQFSTTRPKNTWSYDSALRERSVVLYHYPRLPPKALRCVLLHPSMVMKNYAQ